MAMSILYYVLNEFTLMVMKYLLDEWIILCRFGDQRKEVVK